MGRTFPIFFMLIWCICAQNSTIIDSTYPWLRLPKTPSLPFPQNDYYLKLDDANIWYTIYGSENAIPVLFLHGGLSNSNYWGLQVEALRSDYRCILMDSRGQGRSTLSSSNMTYDAMASDVIALLDYLSINKTHLVGWSDGAVIALNIAMKYSDRLNSLFAFAANYIYSGTKDVTNSTVFMAYFERTKMEYETLNPTPNYTKLLDKIFAMWSILPNWSRSDFETINSKLPIWIVDGDHDEAIYREQPDTMAGWIVQAGELIMPRTSHFAFLQNPSQFNMWLLQFLKDANNIETNNARAFQTINEFLLYILFSYCFCCSLLCEI